MIINYLYFADVACNYWGAVGSLFSPINQASVPSY